MPRLSRSQANRVAHVRSALAALSADAPALAHLRVGADGVVRDVLLGAGGTRAGAGRVLLDWRATALTDALLRGAEGTQFRAGIGVRTVQGRLVERNLLGFDDGQLVEIAFPRGVLSRRGGTWRALARIPSHRLRPRPRAQRGHDEVEDAIVLDASQRTAVEAPAAAGLLILGEAGYGKTTVALHRVARLRRAAGRGYRAAVLVPTDGLCTLARAVLSRLGAGDVAVWRFDRWALAQARATFPDLPARDGVDATPAVMRLKRHGTLRVALQELARRAPAVADEGPEPVRGATREDLLHLFGDADLVRAVVEAARGGIPPHAAGEVLEHARVQFSETTEQEFSHVERARLRPLDGCAIDLGTPHGDADTIDSEDAAVLFELERLRAQVRGGRPALPPQLDCLVLDEAQEFAPLELALAGRSLAPGGSLVVAGDAAQQIDATTSFDGWEASRAELGLARWDVARLEEGHRCPPGVTALARAVRDGGGAPARAGADVLRVRAPSELHLTAWLVQELRRLRERDPGAIVAVVCRSPADTRRAAADLARGLPIREWEGERTLRPGVHVACVQDVRGLEFDHVVVPDALPGCYPDAPDARRALYVALTRARHQAVLATPGDWTPLLDIDTEAAQHT